MQKLYENYADNVSQLDRILRVGESFDIIKKRLVFGGGEATFYYIDGFIKDTVMQKLMMHFLSIKKLPHSARAFLDEALPYVETGESESVDVIVQSVLSGAAVMLASSFGASAVIIDART